MAFKLNNIEFPTYKCISRVFYAKFIWNRSSDIGDRVDRVKKNGQRTKEISKKHFLKHKRNEIFIVQTVYIAIYSLTWCIGWYARKAYTLPSHTKCISLSFQGRIRNNWLAVKNYTNMMFINSVTIGKLFPNSPTSNPKILIQKTTCLL